MTALRARRDAPRLEGWTLHLDGEPPGAVRPEDHDPARRAGRLREQGARAVLAHSSPLGVEELPLRESRHLLDACHEGLAHLGPRLGWWAALPRATAFGSGAGRPLAALLERGAAGLQVPATWLSGPDDVRALGPLLATLQEAGRPLLVHPGPAGAHPHAPRPGWWAPVVDYTVQMATAWWAWQAAARPGLASLRVCFAAGAGLAPVHHERLRARGGPTTQVDPLSFVDLSGYGGQAFDALLRVLGIDVLVSASDHPYAQALDLTHDPAAQRAVCSTNPHRLMTGGTP